jgi:hypothetical protein
MISYVIPTLGTRPDSLNRLIKSLLQAKSVEKIVIVGPSVVVEEIEFQEDRIQFLLEVSKGPVSAINQGLVSINSKYWNWIGDDDYINGSDLDEFFSKKLAFSGDDLYYSNIRYEDKQGNLLMYNNPKTIAKKIIFFGPNLIPQPTCIFPTLTSKSIGGISEKYQLAFDQDFICQLLRRCNAQYVSHNFASYTWHRNSLTQKHRFLSIRESYQIRKKYSLSNKKKLLVIVFYFPTVGIILATDLLLGKLIGWRRHV